MLKNDPSTNHIDVIQLTRDSRQASSLKWRGYCLDDGTGQNVHFIRDDGSQSRQMPTGFEFELFENGDRRFYNRGRCIRCKNPYKSILTICEDGSRAIEFNHCGDCLIATTPSIKRMRKNGNAIYRNNVDTPKTLFIDLHERSTCGSREQDILSRALSAKVWVRQQSKRRRNHDRRYIIAEKAAKYEIYAGEHLSWGADGEDFDEYFGAVNSLNQPHGQGVKFYSDSSVYCGCWKDGIRHNSDNSIGYYLSSLETEYSGTWLCGLKHGKGTQSYPDGSVYTGEFAKGYEHGVGRKRLPDGNYFEGKYRFGRRDGPGVFTTPKGSVLERGVFRDTVSFEDSYPPQIMEVTMAVEKVEEKQGNNTGGTAPGGQNGGQSSGKKEGVADDMLYYDPPSLMKIAFKEIAKHMQPIITATGKQVTLVQSESVSRVIADHLKRRLCIYYIKAMNVKGSSDFREFVMRTNYGFNSPDSVKSCGVKIEPSDISILCAIQGSNKNLKTLTLSTNKLNPNCINSLFHNMSMKIWPNLQNLDLSFNTLDIVSIKNMMHGINDVPTIRSLRLSTCGIRPAGGQLIADFLSSNTTLQELDLSFNYLEAVGATSLAEGLRNNRHLVTLSLRKNSIGFIGGQAFLTLLKANTTLASLCLVDNDIGVDLSAQITGRSRASVGKIIQSTCAGEVRVPQRYLMMIERAKKFNRS